VIVDAGGRAFTHVTGNFSNFLNGASNDPQIMEEVMTLPYADAHPISSIDALIPADLQSFEIGGIFGVSTSTGVSGTGFTAAPLAVSSFNEDVVIEATAVPEPAALGLACGLALWCRRRRS